jgi:hypothetical protein
MMNFEQPRVKAGMTRLTHNSVFCATLLFSAILLCGTTLAQSNRVYVDSIEVVPGTSVSIPFQFQNLVTITSVTVPITYDTALLKLTDINFTGSRGSHLSFKDVLPANYDSANGHFLAAFVGFASDSILPGTGLLFSAQFTVAADASPGTVMSFDTLFYPPGGEFIFVDSLARIIHPEFDGGKIVVTDPNNAPVFDSSLGETINEGDSLILGIKATDPDSDPLTLYPIVVPNGSSFVDNGDGTAVLRWKPEFVGPGSALGSPFHFQFGATDGIDSVSHVEEVTVINVNRSPAITVTDSVTVTAGDSVSVNVVASEPDFEPIAWEVKGLPSGASFSFGNPAELSWRTQIGEHGFYPIEFIASDSLGASDTATVVITVRAATLYFLSVDSGSGEPGQTVTVDVTLENLEPITGFDLLLHYDPTHLALVAAEKAGTSSGDFEVFNITDDDEGVSGNLRIEALADQPGGIAVAPIAPGQGPIVRLTFRIAGGLNLGGFHTSIDFAFLAPANDIDNTILDGAGSRVAASEIGRTPGLINVEKIGEVTTGDINLNSVSYEIGDVILFGNYLVNPVQYPLDAVQLVNTNVNGDNFVATVADYVTLVNIIAAGGPSAAPDNPDLNAKVLLTHEPVAASVTYISDFEVGGIVGRFEVADTSRPVQIENLQPQMEMLSARVGNELRVVWHSPRGARLPQGDQLLARISGNTDVKVKDVEIGSAAGEVTHAGVEHRLPTGFTLAQNYPNPFNPETRIDFSLAAQGNAELTIFNVLGHAIKKIEYRNLPAGSHSVVWDGRNESGSKVASGIYFYRLSTAAGALTRKMTLVK